MYKIIAALWLCTCFSVYAENYFVDAVSGNDSASGNSEQEAWQTIAKVNSFIFSMGDFIFFKKGGVWREQLNLTSISTSSSYITISSFGFGDKPVISGADIINDFIPHTKNIWKTTVESDPQQVFINDIRGNKKAELDELLFDHDWYYNAAQKTLFLYKMNKPEINTVEKTSRLNGVNISGENILVTNIQIEKTEKSGINISSSAKNIVVDGVDFFQWSIFFAGENSAVYTLGNNTEIKNCVFGKITENDILDQNWAGFVGVIVRGSGASIHDNYIYHNSTENESGRGLGASAIKLINFSGTIKVYNNYIYHPGSHGVSIEGYSNKEDSVYIFDNTIEYPGQAGIVAYKTRANDGIGATGFIFRNNVSFSNRLGGDVGSNGSQACGIHMNDGILANTEPEKPFVKWFIYENIIHSSQAPADSTSEDSGGIIADYNAHNVEIFRNLVFNNWGKGISIWNASNCKVYYNIVYGNDAGIILTAANGTLESTNNNEIYNNTFYKNFNGFEKGTNYNAEVYFGKNGHNSIIQNNIFYASDVGYAYLFDPTKSSGIILNHNIIFKDNDSPICFDNKNKAQSFENWKLNHPEWDNNSFEENPIITISPEDFEINGTSPAINNGLYIGQDLDFKKNPIVGEPDIGALEFHGTNGIDPETLPDKFILYQNYPNPFNPATTIQFSINTAQDFLTSASLKIYDALGNVVVTLIDEDLSPGDYKINFHSSVKNGLASGIYLYTLRAGKFSQTKKLILMK